MSSGLSVVKDVFGSFLFSIVFFYIYIHYRKFNAEFNKLIKTVGHRAHFFEKNILNTPTFANKFDFIWIFSYSHLSCNGTLKMLVL